MTSSEYIKALNNISETFGSLRDQINKAFEIGRELGIDDMKIGGDIRAKLRGLVSTSSIQRMLPETAKHQEKVREPAAVNLTANQARLVTDQEPPIPPSPQVVREAETQTDYTITQTERKSPNYHEDTIITIKDKRFSFLELDRARLFAKSTGDSFITIGVRNNEIKIL